jgi:glutamate synthase (NADPH/NADH) large chain
VVLGVTGRNFGAGMSGGIAFVHDPEGVFPAKVNGEMVQLQQPGPEDRSWLAAVLADHLRYTDSAVAERIIAAGEAGLDRFVKVMPTDYERVLDVMKHAEADGLDEEATLVRVMEASRG